MNKLSRKKKIKRRKLASTVLIVSIFAVSCGKQEKLSTPTDSAEAVNQIKISETNTVSSLNNNTLLSKNVVPEFTSLNDANLHQHVENAIYSKLQTDFGSDIQVDIQTRYISNEYIEELTYNSNENVYFGFTATELNNRFNGAPFVFTLNENNQTVVKAFEGSHNIYNKIIKDVAIGTGVILIGVTVTALTGGVAAGSMSFVIATSAKTATTLALAEGALSGAISGIIKGTQTNDFSEIMEASALGASEGFKWGAVGGPLLAGKVLNKLENATELKAVVPLLAP
ncbi:hypothetical protein AN640_05595 [Candidatus Epulonipiscium fishelsonii]|uniref:Uncharacterized protein n=1 Tax=Candidatus Epulonipiscium fishelsonii TaxID=77094 RepID=A0ACC8XHW5_9FIRM|nr:hypothetical protein AN640_05595 [Epulopiscium sp. SCG-D08WGA-EpuloA1]